MVGDGVVVVSSCSSRWLMTWIVAEGWNGGVDWGWLGFGCFCSAVLPRCLVVVGGGQVDDKMTLCRNPLEIKATDSM